MKKGKITPNGVVLEKHENATVVFLTEQGLNVDLIPPSNTKGIKTADIIINNESWEMKSPKGKGRWLLENTLQKAVKQSSNILIDLRRVKIHQTKCLKQLEKQFNYSKGIKHLKIITKTKKIIDLVK